MHEFSLSYLRCVRCSNKLDLEILESKKEIDEGFLFCDKCNLQFPIISKIPILWRNFSAYLSIRRKLGGQLYIKSSKPAMKSFVKKSLSKTKKNLDDTTLIEDRWVKIYLNSRRSRFYTLIKKYLKKIPNSKLVLEHGCSIGTVSKILADQSDMAFGIDKSFNAIMVAKKTQTKNLDYFVSDSINHPFGKQKFDLVVGLNIFELVEPNQLISTVSKQIRNGIVFLSDPYDYDRGKYSVKKPMNHFEVRKELTKNKFSLIKGTKAPSFIPWVLNLNSRTKLHYKVDLIIGKKP